MQGIMNKSNYLLNNLENLLHSFEAEDKDDANCRQQYRERWTRPPSQNLNYQMVQGAQQYIMSLMKAKEYDQKENDDIVNNSKHFEELMQTKEKLNENIPHEEEVPTEETEEEKEIRKEILKLYELKDKCTNIIRPLFIQLNDESKVITQFIDVLAKKTTEQIILERNKDSFQLKFNELKKSSDEIKKQEEVINEVVKKNYDKIMPKANNKGNDDKVDDYYANLYQLSNMFLEKYNKIMKGDKYYNDLKDKIDKLIKYGNDWMINRSNEKNSMINNMNNWQNNQMNNNMQGFGGNPNGF
jgi:programmed cell death 6-interacting protein